MTDQAVNQATFGEINREYFNANIGKIDAEWIQVLQQQILQYIQSHIDWLGIRKPSIGGPPIKMLDYACGSGIASKALVPYVDIIRGIDSPTAWLTDSTTLLVLQAFLSSKCMPPVVTF